MNIHEQINRINERLNAETNPFKRELMRQTIRNLLIQLEA